MVIITSKYVKPLDVIDSLLADHRKFLDDQYKQSKFIFSGPQNPRVGGLIDHEQRPLHDSWRSRV
jgi:uncharacterized protein YciI